MEKSEFANYLSNKGYPVIDDKGIPIIIMSGNDKEMKNTISKIKDMAKECNYNSSFGIKCSMSDDSENRSPDYTIKELENDYKDSNDEFADEDFTQMTLF